MWRSFLIFSACIPGLFLLAVVYFERWLRKRRGERMPLTEKLLRPVGYSLQCKLQDLDDSFNAWFMGTFLFSLLAVGAVASAPVDFAGRMIFLFIFGPVAAGCVIMAWRRLKEIRAYRMGLLGEQAMAEELQSLVALGYRVFHDVPGKEKSDAGYKKDWNIDHVVVGPAGVFAIETKYRTKKRGRSGRTDCDAIFDGNAIQFPSGYDVETQKQARGNARDLADMLSKATGERVLARPIVALPGWRVTLKVNSDLKVLSGKYVSNFIATEPAQLSDKRIQQISYHLEQRCRDVEF